MTLDNMTGITKGSWTVDSLFCKSQLITCNRVNECNGVCPFEDALKHADQEQSLNEQNIGHDREWIIGCIKHDGFIHTHRFDKANQIILDALEASQNLTKPNNSDLISRADAIEAVHKVTIDLLQDRCMPIGCATDFTDAIRELPSALPSADAVHIETYRELYEKYVELKHASAEAVQVVRCKDCRYYQKIAYTNRGICHEKPNRITSQKDDDYCSYAERREP